MVLLAIKPKRRKAVVMDIAKHPLKELLIYLLATLPPLFKVSIPNDYFNDGIMTAIPGNRPKNQVTDSESLNLNSKSTRRLMEFSFG